MHDHSVRLQKIKAVIFAALFLCAFFVLVSGAHAAEYEQLESPMLYSPVPEYLPRNSFEYFIASYPIEMFVLLLLIAIITISAIILLYNRRKRIVERQRAIEAARFGAVVRKSLDEIYEVVMPDDEISRLRFDNSFLVRDKIRMQYTEYVQWVSANVIHPDDSQDYLENFIKPESLAEYILDTQNTFRREYRRKNDNGKYEYHSYSVQLAYYADSHQFRLMIFLQNIQTAKDSEQRTRQALIDAMTAAQKANEAKTSFLSRMSHEIRTPMNAITGYVTIARSSMNDAAKLENCIDKIEITSRHLHNIVNDVLDMSAIESGKITLTTTDFDPHQLLSSIWSEYQMQAQLNDIEFNVSIGDDLPDALMGDPTRVRQILSNLLSNSMKFTPAGKSVSLSATIMAYTRGKANLRFIVADTGMGMSDEFMQNIFMPFEQDKATSSIISGGTGLGLSIVKSLTTMMDGAISVSSKRGEGSTFTIDIPFDIAHSASNDENELTLGSRMLVIDGDKDTCEYIALVVERLGMKCDIAVSGAQGEKMAIEAAASNAPYSLCMMEWRLADMDGAELTRRLRCSAASNIVIDVISSVQAIKIQDEAIAAGVDHVVEKPLFQSTIFDIITNMHGRAPVRRSVEKKEYDFTGKRVLLAEDNPYNLETMTELLKMKHLEVDIAENGQLAVDRFSAAPQDYYDAILMDVQMPVMDGYAATRAIRTSEHAQARSIPIIAMTANAFAEDVSASLSSGMNGHLSKPIETGELFNTLRGIGRK